MNWQQLKNHTPRLISDEKLRQAAVAVVFAGAEDSLSVLLIQRVKRQQDPWSGHLAFPGGMMDSADESLLATARREILEEVGWQPATADCLVRFDDLEGKSAGKPAGLAIASFVFRIPIPVPVGVSDEVEKSLWAPVSELIDTRQHTKFQPYQQAFYPAVRLRDQDLPLLWGMTLRLLQQIMLSAGIVWPNSLPPIGDPETLVS
ncbi:MAG TPA: CoA pyrophosphatase [Gammaproteobacteria bacterium]|nr:CoA pyrophosphatase [Gammaproteobacteria bacterium]